MDDELFNLLTDSFPPEEYHTNIINYESFEKFETDDEYIFTIPLNHIPDTGITISAGSYHIDYCIGDELYSFTLTKPILPKVIKTTLVNGILDIVARKRK
jgi:hypothetical protein